MTPDVPVTDALLHALPKTDLHCHLDGSLRLRTMLELADEQKVRLPADSEDGLARAMKIGQRHGSLEEYLKGFEITLSVLQTEAALFRTAYELAIDAAGAEHGNAAKDHQEAFQLILNNNVNCTVHAGEAYGPPSIAQALHYCGAHRIGHGVRLREDGDLLNYVNDHRIPIECCPSSNVQTGAVVDMASHPFKFYLDFGIRVTVNTDNRLITNTTVSKELIVLARQFNLTVSDVRNVLVAGFKSAFLTFHDRAQLVRRAQQEIGEVLERFGKSELPQEGQRAIPSRAGGRSARCSGSSSRRCRRSSAPGRSGTGGRRTPSTRT